MERSEDYVWITLHDELPPVDARRRLLTVFPNQIKYSIENSKTKADIDVLAREEMENKSTVELFSDFYSLQNNDVAPDARQIKMLERILKEMEEEAK